MTRLTAALLAALLVSGPAFATDADMPQAAGGLQILDARDVDLEAFKWVARPVIVFADTPNDPRFLDQMAMIDARPEILAERDVVVITDTDPAARSAVRERLRPRGFALVLIAKDGTVNMRKPTPWAVREISHAIDKLPMRREEMRQR